MGAWGYINRVANQAGDEGHAGRERPHRGYGSKQAAAGLVTGNWYKDELALLGDGGTGAACLRGWK